MKITNTMKRILITSTIIILSFTLLQAQDKCGRIVYKTLLAHNNYQPIYEELIYYNEEASYTLIKKEKPEKVVTSETGEVILFNEEPDSIYDHITINAAKKEIISKRYLTYDNGKTYIDYVVKEPFEIQWKITKERKKIANYHCWVAKSEFRGRSYTAWFTTDVPLIFGPWKFQGLPGLIVQIIDDSQEISISLEKIETPTTTKPKLFDPITIKQAIDYSEFCDLKRLARERSTEVFERNIKAKLPRGAVIEKNDTGPNTIERDCWK